jgi:hypothetical protein
MPQPEGKPFGPYWNGAADVYADPRAVQATLDLLLDDAQKISAEAQPAPEGVADMAKGMRREAELRILDATIAAFELIRFDKATGTGLMEHDVFAVWNQWLAYVEKKNPEADSGQTCSVPTTSPSGTATTMTTSSTCGSTSPASDSSPRSPWPGEQQLPPTPEMSLPPISMRTV